VGGACGRHGRGEKLVQCFGGKARTKETTRKTKAWMREWDQMDLREIGWGGVEWIHLAQDRDRWRAVVNAVMKLPILAPRS
jgi:hypothetical protein